MMMKQRIKQKHYNKLDHGSDEEETELLVVKSKSPRKQIPSVEINIEEGDTLQSLAIRYHCTIEDIKRLNNIHKDNEIYARIAIKVPHKPFVEALAPVHISGSTTPEKNLIDIEPPQINVLDLSLKIEKSTPESTEVNEIIFNSQIAQKPVDSIPSEREEEVRLLPTAPAESAATKLNCNGIDLDISLTGLLIFIVVMIIAVPLILVFCVVEHPEKFHHQQT